MSQHGPGQVGSDSPRQETERSVRLQILSTEHWSLLASRSLAWNEVFSRTTMFLATHRPGRGGPGPVAHHDPHLLLRRRPPPVWCNVSVGEA